jgi:methylenetetrahydrofolate dehydrogenase (NADP+) / methenyltetrahydrofolate cyclohydrolase
MAVLDPAEIAKTYRDEIRDEIRRLGEPLVLAGFLAAEHGPSKTYADYTAKACSDVGVQFDLRQVARLEAEDAIAQANADASIHGIVVYYPLFGPEHDAYIRDLVEPAKDIEGLHSFWARCLYQNRRFIDAEKRLKAILPCTPLAILKLLEAAGAFDATAEKPLAGKRATIFNRSEVVGRPLASMMANDGAEVVSFDVDGAQLFRPSETGVPGADTHRPPRPYDVSESTVDRETALRDADIVITGVPSRSFPPVSPDEIKPGAICINFSTIKNFREDIVERASVFVPRVGPMTVTMALRNTLRLHRNAQLIRPRAR